MEKKLFLILLLIASSGQTYTQNLKQSIDSAAITYLQTADNFSTLYYGDDYQGYPPAKNHPYLKDILYVKARLVYQNVVYPEVQLRLDMYRNELITQTSDFRNVVLCPKYVELAELHGKHIIYFQTDTMPGCPSSGYYFLLVDGQNKVMEKRILTLIDETTPGRLQRHFVFKTRYYLYKGGVYYTIKNKKSLLKAL